MPTLPRRRGALPTAALGAALALLTLAPSALAAPSGPSRTWVSGIGDDANPCSRTQPCKTLAGAISKTIDGGEINALDSGGFGAVTITIPITIDLSTEHGSVLNPSTHGIVVNAPGDDVILRGIQINGAQLGAGACGASGLNGINIREARSVRVEGGRITNNSLSAIAITPAASDPKVFVSGTRIDNNCANGIKAAPTNGHTVKLTVTDTTIFNSGTALSVGAGVTSWLAGSTITGNAVGLDTAGGGTIDAYADNVIAGNTADGAPTTQRTAPKGDTGATGATGAAGPAGAPGATGATGPAAFKLVVAPVATKLRAKAGSKVKVKYVATATAKATLTVTKGTKKVGTVTGRTVAGTNAITWAPAKRLARGTYRLALRVTGADGQVATAKATVKLG